MSPGAKRDMDDAAGNVEIGLRQPVEGVVGHAIAAHEFRLRTGAERQHALGNSTAASTAMATIRDGAGVSHRDTLRAVPDRGCRACSAMKAVGLFGEIVEHGREQDFALGAASPASDRQSCRSGCSSARRCPIGVRGPGASCSSAGLASARVMSTRCGASASISEVSSSSAWLPWLCSASSAGGAAIARAVVNPQMQHAAVVEPRQRAFDRAPAC